MSTMDLPTARAPCQQSVTVVILYNYSLLLRSIRVFMRDWGSLYISKLMAFYYPLANEVVKGYSNATVLPSVLP
jgi:hypothetical protein